MARGRRTGSRLDNGHVGLWALVSQNLILYIYIYVYYIFFTYNPYKTACGPQPGRRGAGDVSTAAVNGSAIEPMAAVTAPATFDFGATVKKSDAMNWDGSMHFKVLLVVVVVDDDDDVGTWQNGFDVLELLTRES